jgi:hypothetical protein
MIQKIGISHINKIMIMICLTVMLATLVLPQQNVQAVTRVNSSVDSGLSSSTLHDFYRLKAMFVRNEDSIKKLTKNKAKLLNMVDRLREKNNKKWVEMRVLYYDYNSSYQAALSHAYESRVLIYQHAGISDKGKIVNSSMALWTVQRLRGSVLGLMARVKECNQIMVKSYRLMRGK